MRKRIKEFERNRIHKEETDCDVENTILKLWNSILNAFFAVKKLVISLLTIFSSTYSKFFFCIKSCTSKD